MTEKPCTLSAPFPGVAADIFAAVEQERLQDILFQARTRPDLEETTCKTERLLTLYLTPSGLICLPLNFLLLFI